MQDNVTNILDSRYANNLSILSAPYTGLYIFGTRATWTKKHGSIPTERFFSFSSSYLRGANVPGA